MISENRNPKTDPLRRRDSAARRRPKLEGQIQKHMQTDAVRYDSCLEFRVYAATAVCVTKPPESGTPNCSNAPTRTTENDERHIRISDFGFLSDFGLRASEFFP
jgi:hypothetical protein